MIGVVHYQLQTQQMRTTYYRLIYKKDSYAQADLDRGTLDGTPVDPRELTNWRPIALINCGAKLLSSYIASKLKHCLAGVINPDQAGGDLGARYTV